MDGMNDGSFLALWNWCSFSMWNCQGMSRELSCRGMTPCVIPSRRGLEAWGSEDVGSPWFTQKLSQKVSSKRRGNAWKRNNQQHGPTPKTSRTNQKGASWTWFNEESKQVQWWCNRVRLCLRAHTSEQGAVVAAVVGESAPATLVSVRRSVFWRPTTGEMVKIEKW